MVKKGEGVRQGKRGMGGISWKMVGGDRVGRWWGMVKKWSMGGT